MNDPAPRFAATPPARTVLTPSKLNAIARGALEDVLGSVWVEGEISNFLAHRSGHCYFTLKDANAQIRCALFKSRRPGFTAPRIDARDGMQVLLRGRVTLYETRGDYQLVVEHMEEAGEGALRRAFDVLKARLEAEGLFASDRKRALPALPRRIAVLTSPTGAALRDILSVLRRRMPLVEVDLVPVQVQGDGAAAGIVRALEALRGQARHDVVLIARGGGSLEDLWAFNDEALARAIAASPVPVVSAIGHETDFSISDFVADVRAATPSAAAELLVPDARELLRMAGTLQSRLESAMLRRLRDRGQSVDRLWLRLQSQRSDQRLRAMAARLAQVLPRFATALRSRLVQQRLRLSACGRSLATQPVRQRVARLRDRQRTLFDRLIASQTRRLEADRHALRLAGRGLQSASPLALIGRGYAILSDAASGSVIRSVDNVRPGQALKARVADGTLDLRVESATKSVPKRS